MSACILALVSTIPVRKGSCERLLKEIGQQSCVPEGVLLRLDGYGESPAPSSPLPVLCEQRTAELTGAGGRWLWSEALLGNAIQPDDIIINFDDDAVLLEAPDFVRELVSTVESSGGAAAGMGLSLNKKPALPSTYSRGELIYAAGCGLALRASHLEGLRAFHDEIIAAGGPNALGPLGDDDALMSAFLWKRKIRIVHAATGNYFAALGTRATSQTEAKLKRKLPLDAQKKAIKKNTGWPWPMA